MSAERSYAHRTKYTEKPFSFRWEVERFPKLLGSVGDHLNSPLFEAAPGVRMYVSIDRRMMGDEEWLALFLGISPTSTVKEVTLGFTLGLERSPPKLELRSRVITHQFNLNTMSTPWGFPQFVRFAEVIDRTQGFLNDAGILTFFAKGRYSSDETMILTPKGGFLEELQDVIHKKRIENHRKLFAEGLYTDFVVKVKDAEGAEKALKVHKAILAVGSEVFAVMLANGELKECREGQLEVDDIDYVTMKALIHFLYTGQLASDCCSSECGLELLVAADKYQIEELKKMVEHRLSSKISAENVCSLLIDAERLYAPFLKAQCVEFIRAHHKLVVKSEGWQLLSSPETFHLVGDLFSSGDEGDKEQLQIK